MFINFFFDLKQANLPVSLKEYLMLMEAMDKRVIDSFNVNDFYYLSRSALVKDERHLDKFDRVFGHSFRGLESGEEGAVTEIPEEWLKLMGQKYLTDEEKKLIESLGGWDKLMETLKKRLEEQKERHQGGNKWIGTGGTSPFGAYGYNPEGIRIGQKESRNKKAVKVSAPSRANLLKRRNAIFMFLVPNSTSPSKLLNSLLSQTFTAFLLRLSF
jgi:hypothetical protein